jgi:hypothetical protein
MLVSFSTRCLAINASYFGGENHMNFERAIKAAALFALGTALLATPSFAKNANSSNGSANGATHSASNNGQSKLAAAKAENGQGSIASAFGKLNGFMHASPKALAHASENSAIGKVAIVYAGLLQSYLSDPTSATLLDLQGALADAANKPLSPEIIQAVNDKLATIDPTLGTYILGYLGGSEALATDIAGAI